jgi:hypothetical protein
MLPSVIGSALAARHLRRDGLAALILEEEMTPAAIVRLLSLSFHSSAGRDAALMLQLSAEAWDNSRAAREAVQRNGAYLRSTCGALVPHPGLKQEIDSARSFSQIIKQLGLDGVPDPGAFEAMHKRRR